MNSTTLIERLNSISMSLASFNRITGPKVTCPKLKKTVGGPHVSISDFGDSVLTVLYNLTPAELYEHALKEPGTKISSNGALISYSGKKTGRSPKDKRIVES